jgi:hypothetical protein
MPRPLPIFPRAPRRSRPLGSHPAFLACSRSSPHWELAALRALMKPQTKDAILHRSSVQQWPATADDALERALSIVRDRLDFHPRVHRPRGGDFHLLIEFPPRQIEEAKALAALLSRRVPELWFTLGRLHLQNGRFFRRERGYKLQLVPATNVHLKREIRSALHPFL